jgi:hypothetical protein
VSSALTGFVFAWSVAYGGWLAYSIPCWVSASPLFVIAFATLVWLPSDTHLSTSQWRQRSKASVAVVPTADDKRVASQSDASGIELVDVEADEDEKVVLVPAATAAAIATTPAAVAPLERFALVPGLKLMVSDENTILLTVIYSINSFCNGSILVSQYPRVAVLGPAITVGYLRFGPMAQCVVHALKSLACRARVTPASSPASHCKQCSALTSPSLHARGCASPSRAR